MQFGGHFSGLTFLAVAANDNDDLLSLPFPSLELAIIREMKNLLRFENSQTGMLLRSRKDRNFFQEVSDAEHYILLRYFSLNVPEAALRNLKRRILDRYLFPRRRRKKKKS